MARSSSFTFVLVAIGGAAVGFLAAQIIPLPGQTADEAPAETAETTDQPSVAEAIVGLEKLTLDERMRGEITSS